MIDTNAFNIYQGILSTNNQALAVTAQHGDFFPYLNLLGTFTFYEIVNIYAYIYVYLT